VSMRTLLFSLALVALSIGLLSTFNTLLAAVVERTNELSVMRALGASRSQIVGLITTEALLLALLGSTVGIVLAMIAGHGIEYLVKDFVPLAPRHSFLSPTLPIIAQSVGIGVAAGVIGAL